MKTNKLTYIPLNSSIHKVNPAMKILYLIFYLVLCFLPHNLDYIVLASFILVGYLLISSKIPLGLYLQNIFKTIAIIIAMFVILASLNYTLMGSVLIVLKFVFAICLYSMIIYTTKPFDLAMGIYSIINCLNIIGIDNRGLFIWIYNKVLFRYDYNREMNSCIEGLEIKGRQIRNKNLIARFFIKLDLVPLVISKVRTISKKRKRTILRNKFNLHNYKISTRIIDVIYLLAFVLLIVLYISKVVSI